MKKALRFYCILVIFLQFGLCWRPAASETFQTPPASPTPSDVSSVLPSPPPIAIVTNAPAPNGTTFTPAPSLPVSNVFVPAETAPALNLREAEKEISRLNTMLGREEESAGATQRHFAMLMYLVILLIPASFASGMFFARYKNYQELHQKFRTMLEKGIPVSVELLSGTPAKVPRRSDFRRGIICICLGMALMILLGAIFPGHSDSPGTWGLGLIPTFVGAGYLVLWLLDRKREEQ
jgi:hypothetical protein